MKWHIIRRFLIFLRPYRWQEVVLCLLMLLSSTGALATPYFLKMIIDQVFPAKDAELLIQILLLLVGIYIFRLVITYFADYLYSWLSNRIVVDIRNDLFNRIMHYPFSYFQNNKAGELHHKINNEVSKIQQTLTNSIIRLLNNIFTIGGIIVMLCILNFRLALMAAIVFPFLYINIRIFTPGLRKIYEKVSHAEADLNSFFIDRFNAIKLIQTFNAYTFENNNLQQKQQVYSQWFLKSTIHSSVNRNIATFLIALGPLIVFGWGGLDVLKGTMTLGGLVAFLQYLNRVYSPSTDLMYLHTDLQRAYVSMEQLYQLYEQPVMTNEGTLATIQRGTISFRNVRFGYNGTDVLKNCHFTLYPGKCYAITGASGCGKSTLLHLLCRLYTPNAGTISIDGVPLEEIDLHTLRAHITLVSQEGSIFHDTVARNITYNSDADMRPVVKAIGLDTLIRQLPAGAHTVIGNTGLTISGGQAQKINIARGLLRHSSILLLDEATSALDAVSEQQILNNIRDSKQYDTILLVGHRLSTIKHADEIIFLENGQVKEQGTHEELLLQKGDYYQLFKNQLITKEETIS